MRVRRCPWVARPTLLQNLLPPRPGPRLVLSLSPGPFVSPIVSAVVSPVVSAYVRVATSSHFVSGLSPRPVSSLGCLWVV